MKRDSIANTFVVAGSLCIVCSLLVSGAAVFLKSAQTRNQELDKKRNILAAAGLLEEGMSAEDVEAMFPGGEDSKPSGYWIDTIIVDLDTGEVITGEYDDPAGYDQFRAAKTADGGDAIEKAEDLAKLNDREKHSQVFLVMNGENPVPETYVFPVRGKGLWSTLYGFLAVANDLNSIKGLTFYQHGETPGLGGEVDNEKWKAQWTDNKQLFAVVDGSVDREEVKIEVVKGAAAAPELEYKIDGLSGATITSTGVTNLLRYWMGPNGFGNYLNQLQGDDNSDAQVSRDVSGGAQNG